MVLRPDMQVVGCECAGRRTNGRALRPLRQVAPGAFRRLHWSTTPDPGPALSRARSWHHAESCGQSLVSVQTEERKDVHCVKSRKLPLASCTGAPPRLTPIPPLLRHVRNITPSLVGSRLYGREPENRGACSAASSHASCRSSPAVVSFNPRPRSVLTRDCMQLSA